MRVMVTGGAGFIGSHLVARLRASGDTVTVVDRRAAEPLDVTAQEFPAAVAAARPEVIFHLAAQIDVRASVEDPGQDATANVLGTVAVLEAARRAGARKVVLASTVAIFGPPESLPVTEDTPTRPLSPYAVSKLSAELYLRQYADLHGLETTTLVLTNTYGPGQDPHGEAGVVAIFADALLAGRPTRVYGNVRDYLYVDDAVDAFLRASGPVGNGRRFVVGTGVPVADLELHDAVAEAVGVSVTPPSAPPRLGDLPAMVVDAGLARSVLGWTPRTPLGAGLAATVATLRG